MKRKNDWMVRLNKVLDDYSGGVDPDKINCGEYISDAIRAMTGEDPMADFRGLTLEEQVEKLESLGFKGPLEYAESILPTVPYTKANVGDIAAFSTSGLPAFGVVIGDYAKIISPEGQPGLLPIEKAKKVFQL